MEQYFPNILRENNFELKFYTQSSKKMKKTLSEMYSREFATHISSVITRLDTPIFCLINPKGQSSIHEAMVSQGARKPHDSVYTDTDGTLKKRSSKPKYRSCQRGRWHQERAEGTHPETSETDRKVFEYG